MNFITFPVNSTNIFPIANSVSGGQLLSEWNLRSREMVGTHSTVKFDIGPSYVHSKDDFSIGVQSDNVGTAISSTVLQISEGKGLVNGHFIQSLVPVTIDIAEANMQRQNDNQDPLKGRLGVGLRAMYSTEATLAGSLEAENIEDSMYAGIQVVILPLSDIKTPEDVRESSNQYQVNCHLLLGFFDYINGQITNVNNNDEKIRYIDGDRISNIDDLISSTYISRAGLNSKKLYILSGKSPTPEQRNTWCEAVDSLMVWDKTNYNDNNYTYTPPSLEAKFVTVADDEHVKLVMPHKQVDGMVDTDLRPIYFPDKVLDLPIASYDGNTPGTVSPTYTKNIKLIASKLADVYHLAKGKQVAYKESIASEEDLPRINPAWDIGDYILVREDYSIYSNADSASSPSTFYAVIPGYISGISYFGAVEDSDEVPRGLAGVELESIVINSIPVEETVVPGEALSKDYLPHIPISSQIVTIILAGSFVYEVKNTDLIDTDAEDGETENFTISTNYSVDHERTKLVSTNAAFQNTYGSSTDENIVWGATSVTLKRPNDKTWEQCGVQVGDSIIVIFDSTASMENPGVPSATMQLISGSDFNPITGTIYNEGVLKALTYASPKALYKYFKVTQADLFADISSFRGEKNKDYFVARYDYTTDNMDGTTTSHYTNYYFMVSDSMPNAWSGPLLLTGQMSFAQESAIGGFFNVPTTSEYTDAGYVYLDDSGHLRVRDYSLLRAGTLAYQLGEDIEEFGNGESLSTIQETLDEAINDRVAFPTQAQMKNSDTPNVINITINLTDETKENDEDSGIRNIYIRNIDSRFNTSVYFHFTGNATKNTIINFVDCEKIRIDSNICGTSITNTYVSGPIINVYRCGLYYDPAVMNYIASCDRTYGDSFSTYDYEEGVFYSDYYPSWFTGMKDIKLWYQAYTDTDPNLTVDDMTVNELDVAMESQDVDFWTPEAPNDNHYSVALSSLSFGGDGTIIKCGLLVADNATTNVSTADSIILCDFELPQGAGLLYPQCCLTRQLKITGTFTAAYYSDQLWRVAETSFTAITEKYDRYNSEKSATGSIAFHSKVSLIQASLGANAEAAGTIAPWASDTYNVFYGGIIC